MESLRRINNSIKNPVFTRRIANVYVLRILSQYDNPIEREGRNHMKKGVWLSTFIVLLSLCILSGCTSQSDKSIMEELAEYFSNDNRWQVYYDDDGKSNVEFCEGENSVLCYRYKYSTAEVAKDYEVLQMEYWNKTLYKDVVLNITYPDKIINYEGANEEKRILINELKDDFDKRLQEKELDWEHLDDIMYQLRLRDAYRH